MPAGVGSAKGTILGTCEDMCPHAEIVKRCNIEDVPLFERRDPRVATTNTELAVKKFSRNVSLLHWLSDLQSKMPQREVRIPSVQQDGCRHNAWRYFQRRYEPVWICIHPA